MLDSGAQLELMREDVTKQLETKLDRTTTNGTNFNGGRIILIGEKELNVNFGGCKKKLTFHIVENMKFPIILGICAMRIFQMIWEFANNSVNIGEGLPVRTEEFIEEDMIYSINEIKLLLSFQNSLKTLILLQRLNQLKLNHMKSP